MKSIRNLPVVLFILGGCLALISLLHAQAEDTAVAVPMGTATLTATPVQEMTDEQVMLQAVEQTTPTSATNLPADGNFHSAQHPEWPPLPGNIWNVPGWNIGGNVIILDDRAIDFQAASEARAVSLSASSGRMSLMSMDESEGGGGMMMSMMSSFPSNSLNIQIFCLSNGIAYLSLNNATDSVYEIMSEVALTNASWNIETEVWPTNSTAMPFTVPEGNRTNTLFFWARDWTGVDDNTKLDTTPPQLIVTSPTTNTVNEPVVQLTGYSPEALAGIAYDLTNASGAFSNQQALITGQSYSTNTVEFTTNWFQCFDVAITNGVNHFTLHATDLAGNVTTLTTNFTLSYSIQMAGKRHFSNEQFYTMDRVFSNSECEWRF